MVKQLFPSSKSVPVRPAQQPSTFSPVKAKLDAVEKAKKEAVEEKKLAEMEKAISNCLGVDIKQKSKEDACDEIEKAFTDLTPYHLQVVPEPKKPAKVMFKETAIIDAIDDLPMNIQKHPIVQGMNNRNIRRAYFLAADIKITDTKALFEFGDYRRQFFTDVVNQIVDTAKKPAIQQANTIIENICKTMKEVNIRAILKTEKHGWFQNIFGGESVGKLEHTTDWFNSTTQSIDNQLIEVDALIAVLFTQIDQLDVLYIRNKDSFELLQIEVAAGKFFIDAAESEINMAEAKDAFVASEIAYHKMCLSQFGNKIVDLEAIAQSVLTNAPQIRLMQINIQGLGEQIKSIKLIYARWKQQFSNLITNMQSSLAKAIGSDDPLKLLDMHASLVADFTATQQSLPAIR